MTEVKSTAPVDAAADAGDVFVLPASFTQQRLWFLDRSSRGGPAYNVFAAFRLAGAVDLRALDRSLQIVVERHEALRTTFEDTDGEPMQVVAPSLTIPLESIDGAARGLTTDAALRAYLSAEAGRPFDLARGPLLRAQLIALAPDAAVLLLVTHHICVDGWSLRLLLEELSQAYAALVSHTAPALPDLPIQYGDYAVWQQEWLKDPAVAEGLDFWRQHLAGELTTLELPRDRQRPPAASFRGETLPFHLSAPLTRAINDFSRAEGASLFMTMLAAFSVVLSRYTGHEDVLIGSPIANRLRPELEHAIGFFANTVVFRSDLSGTPTFRELLARVRRMALEVYAHQEVPFEHVVRAVRPERTAGVNPLFQVMFAAQKMPDALLTLPGVTVSPLFVDNGTAKFDLLVELQERSDGIDGIFEINTDLFDRDAMAQVLAHYQTSVERLLAQPDLPIAQVDFLSADERRRLLHDWNDTAADWGDRDATPGIHDLIAAQAARTPEAIAIVNGGRPSEGRSPRAVDASDDAARVADRTSGDRLTYRELETQANALAARLIARGIGPDSLVALSVERTPRMVVAMLAVLKAGAAYLPLDPEHPAARRAFILRDAQAALLLTDRAMDDVDGSQTPALRIDRAADDEPDAADTATRVSQAAAGVNADGRVAAAAAHKMRPATPDESAPDFRPAQPTRPARATDPAYVIYTSGSTGQPKGVVVSHGGVVNLLRTLRRAPGLTADDVVLALTTLTFDIAVFELLLPLSVGATSVIAPSTDVTDGRAIADLIARNDVTVVQATPASWRLLLEAGWRGRPGLRMVTGGEPLTRDLADALLARGAALWNGYGPTETTVYSTFAHVAPDGPIVIGRPVANTQCYILDAHRQLVPPGATGELYIAGAGVANGYHGRPDLTAERFLRDPFAEAPGARMYKTGDLVRHRATGEIEYQGRVDHQVKLRGFRIELGEIEAVLAAHPAVAGAAVTLREDRAGDPRIVAYIVPAVEHQEPDAAQMQARAAVFDTEALRAHLKERLPQYMVPAAIVALDAFPRTPSGKIDRRALPAPTAGQAASGVDRIAPRTDAEQTLAAIWQALLGLDVPGVHSDFFDLGGHSLLAMRLVAEIAHRFDLLLPVNTIFDHSTLEALAAQIDAQRLARDARQTAATAAAADVEGSDVREGADAPSAVDAARDAGQRSSRGAGDGAGAFGPPIPARPEGERLAQPETIAAGAGRLIQAADARADVRRQIDGLDDDVVVLPASFSQQRLWFLDAATQGASPYNISVTFTLHGALDTDALTRAMQTVVSRHDALRTTFAEVDGTPVQVVRGQATFALDRRDLSAANTPTVSDTRAAASTASAAPRAVDAAAAAPALSAPGAASPLDALLVADATRPFDLRRGPLLRALLVSLAPDRAVLQIVVHHIVVDGWSAQVLLQELTAAYADIVTPSAPADTDVSGTRATGAAGSHAVDMADGAVAADAAAGSAAPLHGRPAAVQYGDYVLWQQTSRQPEQREQGLAFWREQLAGELTTLAMPQARQRPPVATFRGASMPFSLDPALTRALNDLSRAEGASVFMTLLASLAVVLGRYTGQDDLLVGSPIANRMRPELEQAIGFFANTVVLRCDLSGDPTFRTLLARVRQRAIAVYAHQDVPFEEVVRAVKPDRVPGVNPLFQVMLTMRPASDGALALPGVEAAPYFVGHTTSKFDLLLEIQEGRDRIDGMFEFSTDLFDRDAMVQWLGHFQSTIARAVAQPDLPIAHLDILSAAERHALLHDANATAVDWFGTDAAPCVHDLMAAQAARTPNAIAVVGGRERLTYRELDQQAAQLALQLVSRGIGPGALVALSVERTPRMLIALLAVLKAGAAYLPLDPDHPAARRDFILQDANVALILSDTPFASDAAPTLRLDQPLPALSAAALAAATAAPGARPSDPAYVIYTSGSTGQPKGVIVPHRAVVNFLLSMAREPGLRPDDVVLALTTLTFDIAVYELLTPLVIGARTVIAPTTDVSDGHALARLVDEQGVTIVQATPSSWRLLLEAGWRGKPGLTMVSGGEPLTRDLADALLARGAALWNFYGPTETTIWSTIARVERDGPILIGRPIANTQCYVLDERRQLVPPGVLGELYIGGQGVARGYHERPDLTEQRFVPDPFSAVPGARMYRTGDLVRARADAGGALECLGRTDHQVKLRGFRIELGEIEAVLGAHPQVAGAAVVVREDRPGDPRLVAYVVPTNQEGTPNLDGLRAHLKDRLPAYMVPAAIVPLAVLPRTSSGKLDRRALPAPAAGAGASDDLDRVAPRDDVERRLAEIWRELLGVDVPSVHDDFFDLGGHSLLAMRLVAKIEALFGRRLPLGALFEGGTIAGLARLIAADPGAATRRGETLVLFRGTGGERPPLFLLHAVGGEVMIYTPLAAIVGVDRPVYGIQADGWTDEDLREITIEKMATRYIREIRAVQPHGPYHFGGFCAGATVALEMAHQLRAAGEEVALIAIFDHQPFEPRTDQALPVRLWRFARNLPLWMADDLFRISPTELAGRIRSRLRMVRNRLRGAGRRPDAKPADVRDILGMWRFADHLAPLIEHLFRAVLAYAPKPYDGRLALFRSRCGPLLGPWPDEHDYGWSRLTRRPIPVEVLPGSHSTLLLPPFVAQLGARMRTSLLEVEASPQEETPRARQPVSAPSTAR